MNTFQLSCFLAVADTLNFARAAQQLHVTQPAITHQIHSLETELNTKLFRRTTRVVELTPAGILFLNDARNILSISIRAKNRFQNPTAPQLQVFSIGCHSYTQLFLLPDILKEMAALYPHIYPALRAVPFEYLYRLLEDEEVDVIIGFQEPDTKKVPGIYQELAKIPIVCLCSFQNPLASRSSVTLEEMEGEKLVLGAPAKSPENIVQLQRQLIGKRSPDDFFFCESSEAALVLVQAGFGLTMLPDLFWSRTPPVARIPVEGAQPLSFGIYYKEAQKSPLLKSFIRIMKEFIDNNKAEEIPPSPDRNKSR